MANRWWAANSHFNTTDSNIYLHHWILNLAKANKHLLCSVTYRNCDTVHIKWEMLESWKANSVRLLPRSYQHCHKGFFSKLPSGHEEVVTVRHTTSYTVHNVLFLYSGLMQRHNCSVHYALYYTENLQYWSNHATQLDTVHPALYTIVYLRRSNCSVHSDLSGCHHTG